jgi:hypothetical protein
MPALHALGVRLPEGSHATRSTRRPTVRRLAIVAATVALGLGIAAPAYAAGTFGHSSAPAGQALRISEGAAVADLYPGSHGSVVVQVTNMTDAALTPTAATMGAVVVESSAGTCGASDFVVANSTPAAVTIAAGATRTVVLPGAVTMKQSAGAGCQGAVLRITATVTAA